MTSGWWGCLLDSRIRLIKGQMAAKKDKLKRKIIFNISEYSHVQSCQICLVVKCKIK